MMETLINILQTVALPLATAVLGWFGSKFKTKRENKKSDIELINQSIAPLLKSISELTAHVKEANSDLIAERRKNIELINERNTLIAKMDEMGVKIQKLENALTRLSKKLKENEKNNSAPGGDMPDGM